MSTFRIGELEMPGRGGADGIAKSIVTRLLDVPEGSKKFVFVPLSEYKGKNGAKSLTGTLYHTAKEHGMTVLVRPGIENPAEVLEDNDEAIEGYLVWRRPAKASWATK